MVVILLSSKVTRPQFYFRTTDITGACELPDGVEMVMPGDNIQMDITLINPVAMEEGLRFAIREGRSYSRCWRLYLKLLNKIND